MPQNVSDEVFARYVNQIGNATLDQIEAAKAAQAQSAKRGVPISLGEALVQQGVLTPAIRENVEKKLAAQQLGGLKQLGSYKLLRKLGEGGMGAVYLAEDLNVGRMVAVKVLLKKHAADPEFATRFRREARAAGRLNHVNIVGAHDVGEEMGHHFLVMEYCEGEPLDKLLKREQHLPWDRALEIVIQVARGLKHAHEHGFIHRDIKPANILLCKPLGGSQAGGPGVAKILDLGLSKNVGAGEQSFATQTGVALGTPHYISPEQAKGEKTIDGRTDIYSLGAMFYHLITGQTPFQGSTAAIIIVKHINEQLPNPRDVREDIPDGVAHVIQRMMAKEPGDRYRDCKELLNDLELVIDGKEPSSQAMDAGKSSVALPRMARARKLGAAVPGLRHTAGPVPPAGMRQHVPVDLRGAGQPAADQAEAGIATPPSSKRSLYIAAAFGALAVLAVAIGLVASRSRERQAAVRAVEEKRKVKADTTARLAEQKRKAEEARLESEAARLEEEQRKLANDKRKAEEARLAAEAAARKKTEEEAKTQAVRPPVAPANPPPIPEAEPPPMQPDTKAGETPAVRRDGETPAVRSAGETPAVQTAAEDRAAKAQQLFTSALKECAPLLAQNKFVEATALLERRAKHPAWAEASEQLRQGKADIEALVELRRSAIEALRKQVGQQVTLRKGGTVTKAKVVADSLSMTSLPPGERGVMLDLGGPQMMFRAAQLSPEDVEQYAPSTGNAGTDLRLRGILYLAAGNMAKAKEYFIKPETLNAGPYLDCLAPEAEVIAQRAWEGAERLFAANDMAGARLAYRVFERDYGATQTAAKQAAALKERYDAIEKGGRRLKNLALDLGGGVKVELVLIPAGTFTMGSPDDEAGREGDGREGPQHEVTITKPFYIGKYEVTVAQFRRFAESTNYQTTSETNGNKGWDWINGLKELEGVNWMKPGFLQEENHPVDLVTRDDAQAFIAWAARVTGRTVRLPTEAEWEYACRAGAKTRFNIGQDDQDLEKAGWFKKISERRTHAVGQKAPNAWGLYDMHGNVWEWCEDRYQMDYYKPAPAADPPGPPGGREYVRRGGAWDCAASQCRSASRVSAFPGWSFTSNGFRLVVECGASETPGRAALPAEEQVRNVVEELKGLNPAYAGKYERQIEGGKVTRFGLTGKEVRDLSPLRALTALRDLDLNGCWGVTDLSPLKGLKLERMTLWATRVKDLSPLKGMPLESLNCGYCEVADLSPVAGMPLKVIYLSYLRVATIAPLNGMALQHIEFHDTPVKDLSPLVGMPLRRVDFTNTPVTDISALKDMPLEEVKLSFKPERDAAVLRSIRTLKKINELPAEEFWRKYDTTAVQPETKSLKPDTLTKEVSLDLGGGVKMEMVLVKAGEFDMGSNGGEGCEKPVHRVKISKPFYMGKYEVTVAQFRAFADAAKFVTDAEKCGKGTTWKDGGWKDELAGINWRTPGFPQEDNYPACVITWNDAQEFCKWAAKKTGRAVCLPTEARWEYACRAGTTTKFNTSDKDSDLEEAGWFHKNSGMHTNAVGKKKPNAWGLYDMHGNVWEWVQDYFNDRYYGESPPVDPKGPTSGRDRVMRGGSWPDSPVLCRSARRGRNDPDHRDAGNGFRCAVDF